MLLRIAIPPRTSSTSKAYSVLLPALLLLAAASSSAQSPAPSAPQSGAPPEDAPYTLHVYTDLVQIPTLVLAPNLDPVPEIPRERFNISLDSGPIFHPTQLQIEGDEPITLALLVDMSSDERYSIDSLAAAIQPFATSSLLAHDHVSIFAVDCNMIRTSLNKPADDPAAITTAFQTAINSPRIYGDAHRPHCADSRRLWNDIGAVAETLADQPGRHVMIVISDGVDHRSPVPWEMLRRYFIRHSIAMFGITPPLPIGGAPLTRAKFLEGPFEQLAESSGGMVLHTTPNSLASNLQRVIRLVRGRYILQFPRPYNGANGLHSILVTVSRSNDFVRTTGIAYPSRDPSLQNAPDTIPSNPSPAKFGDHKILTAPQ